MKSIYVRNLFGSYLRKKKMVIICWINIVILFGGLGIFKAYPEKISSDMSDEAQEYREALQQYDDAIANTQENISITQQQTDAQKKYCDESVLMQMDASNVQVAGIQYAVKTEDRNTDEESNQTESLLEAWTMYIMGDSLISQVSEKLGEVPEEYLSELISCDTAGNMLTVSVKHFDMEQAKEILEAVEEEITDYQGTMADTFGSFEMIVMNSSETVTSDTDVLNIQNTNLNSLRGYQNSLADYQAKLVSQQTTKNTYMEQNKPSGVNSPSPKKTLLEYGALGVIAGIIIPFIIYALWYTMSGRIKGKEELVAAGLNVLTVYNPKKGYAPSAERSAADLKLLAQQNKVDTICFSLLGESTALQQVVSEFTTAMEALDAAVLSVRAGQEDTEQLQIMVNAGNSILFAEAGRTTYAQIEEQLQFCRRFHISVWGCVVVE